MGNIYSASISFTRFRVIDPIPSELLTQIPEKLRQFAFRGIDDLPEMQAYGWVCFEDMLDTEWRTAPPQKGNYFTFSLRLDTRRIPPAIIKKQLSLALKAEKEKIQAQGKKFISRERKKGPQGTSPATPAPAFSAHSSRVQCRLGAGSQ